MKISKFNYIILFCFILLEVLLFGKSNDFQLIITLSEYLFIIICLISNSKIGIMYFVSFSLLTMGSWSYVIDNELPNNFWGLRFFGVSFNGVFTVILFLYLIIKKGFVRKNIFIIFEKKYFIFFISYSLILGVFNTINSTNYFDNFNKDLLLYSSMLLYVYIIDFLDLKSLLQIIKYCISLTVVSMLLSYVVDIKFQYAIGYKFVLMNTFAFILPFSILFFNKLFPKKHFLFLIISLFYLIISGQVFIGGKTIIIIIITLFWFLARQKKTIILIPILFLLITPTLLFVFPLVKNNSILSYRFIQVLEGVNLYNMRGLLDSNTSLGNIVGEAITTIFYLKKNAFFLLFGKGFGAGIKDVFGYLGPWAGTSGYAYHDLIRNDFFKMHLPIFEIIIKSGLFGFILYLYLLIKNFMRNNIYSFIFFILALTVFHQSKEMTLLMILFLEIINKEQNLKLNNKN